METKSEQGLYSICIRNHLDKILAELDLTNLVTEPNWLAPFQVNHHVSCIAGIFKKDFAVQTYHFIPRLKKLKCFKTNDFNAAAARSFSVSTALFPRVAISNRLYQK